MNAPQQPNNLVLSISAVERDTGLSKDTLRIWERRYGFPQPLRDTFGERIYPSEQVDRLRTIRRLMDAGHRPGRIIGLDTNALQALSDRIPETVTTSHEDPALDLDQLMALIRAAQADDIRAELGNRLMRLGLQRFVTELAAPLIDHVGESWSRGQLQIYEEHLFTESMQVVLRNAISTIPTPRDQPKVLLTTFPGEPHGMGLLMVEALMSIEGCHCTSLGVQTPVWDVVLAAQAQKTDLVVLSFSAAAPPVLVTEALADLRDKLPGETEIWAGGRCAALARRAPRGVKVVNGFDQLRGFIASWRSARGL